MDGGWKCGIKVAQGWFLRGLSPGPVDALFSVWLVPVSYKDHSDWIRVHPNDLWPCF